MAQEYYIITTAHQSIWPGGVLLFWAPNSNGYATFLEAAGRYSEEEARKIVQLRPDGDVQRDFMVPCQLVEKEAIHVVDYDKLSSLIADTRQPSWWKRRQGRIYRGFPAEAGEEDPTITVDGEDLTPEASLKLRNHSPTGFSWGYCGSGPAQMALAILLDCLEDQQQALELYQDFKVEVVSRWLQGQKWSITEREIRTFCTTLQTQRLNQ